jgi:hypothetical protein
VLMNAGTKHAGNSPVDVRHDGRDRDDQPDNFAVFSIWSVFMLAVKMATSSLDSFSRTSSSSGRARRFAAITRSHRRDSRASFRTIDVLALKSRREYAALPLRNSPRSRFRIGQLPRNPSCDAGLRRQLQAEPNDSARKRERPVSEVALFVGCHVHGEGNRLASSRSRAAPSAASRRFCPCAATFLFPYFSLLTSNF